MAKYLNIQVPSSCREAWNNMSAESNGRYCSSCQKTVIDFTRMSDMELMQFFRDHKGSTCGRFTKDQLDRDLQLPPKPLPWVSHFFKITLPAFLLSLKSGVQAQSCPPTVIIEQPKQKATFTANVSDTSSVVSGTVKDKEGYPIPHATIMIKGTRIGAAADEKGHYTIKVHTLPATLVFSAVGFETSEYVVTKFAVAPIDQLLDYVLREMTLGAVVVTTYKKQKARVKLEKPAALPSILLYPNPLMAGNDVQIQCTNMDKGKYLAELFSLSAQLLQTSHITIHKSHDLITLPIKKLFPATYILKLTNEKTGKEFSQQLIIQ